MKEQGFKQFKQSMTALILKDVGDNERCPLRKIRFCCAQLHNQSEGRKNASSHLKAKRHQPSCLYGIPRVDFVGQIPLECECQDREDCASPQCRRKH